MTGEKDREEWTEEDERRLEGEEKAKPMPVEEVGLAVGLEGQDGFNADVDPRIVEEVRLEDETREAEGEEEHVETVLNFRDDDEEEEKD